MPSKPQAETGALLKASPATVNRRVIGALLIREMLTRYGRNNIGFLWLFVEPMVFVFLIAMFWAATRVIHGSNVPIVAFALTGYCSLLLWRTTASRCIGAVKSNRPLLFHRQVTILDIFTARIVLEFMAVTTALTVLAIVLNLFAFLPLPEDVLQVLAAWMLLAWFAAGLGLTIGGLSEKFPVIGRFWHPFSYALMIVSGVAFLVESLPPATRELVLWVPMINAVEYMREGWFGSEITAYYDLPYLTYCNIGLTLLGLMLVRSVAFDTSEE